jgi:hypothetical protein
MDLKSSPVKPGQVWRRRDPSGTRTTEFEVSYITEHGGSIRVFGRTSGGRIVTALLAHMVKGERFELIHSRYCKESPDA